MATDTGKPDTDALPPTQYLVLEVLAARARLGENAWTFPTRVRPALEALSRQGLVWWKSATIYGYCLAGLTDAGRDAVLIAGYTVPATIEIRYGVRHGFGENEKVRDCGDDEQLARDLASDYAKAGMGGVPVLCRIIHEKPMQLPDEETMAELRRTSPSLRS